VLTNEFDEGANLAFMVSAQDVFGAMSDGRVGTGDLSPALSAATRLSDVAGTLGTGVYKGKISITNGAATATVDLTDADTIGDVLTRINAVSGTTDVTAAIAADGTIDLTAATGTVAVNDVAGGTTARDLGILQTVAAGTVDGADAKPRMTGLTLLADLRGGAGLDPTGFTITNGSKSATISMAGLTTVEDLLNRINGSGTEVVARINADGNSIDILNPVQGASMTISENGGITATHMGLRTMSPGHLLTELNNGKGVRTVDGPDITITRQDGTGFSVDLDGTTTVNDVMNAINAVAGSTMATFAATGNGIVLTDTTTGGSTFRVEAANFSPAAGDLGLLASPAVGGVITGVDVNPETSSGVFNNLTRLRDALRASDQTKITEAASGIEDDLARIARVRGVTGARVQELESRENRITDENLATQTLLAGLQETDYTSAITRYTTLQTTLEAAMKTTNQVSNLSLLDFLG
jgi:flagellar hook-associated protein 3 FlgL